LDTEATLAIIRHTAPFVDLFKVGRANYLPMTKKTDWKQFTAEVVAVLAETGSKHYIKRDLQPYLPAGYKNPLRVDQFRSDLANPSSADFGAIRNIHLDILRNENNSES